MLGQAKRRKKEGLSDSYIEFSRIKHTSSPKITPPCRGNTKEERRYNETMINDINKKHNKQGPAKPLLTEMCD